MKSKCILYLLISYLVIAKADAQLSELDSLNGIQLIADVESFAKSELRMSIHSNYYKKWASNENPNIFVYISDRDSILALNNRNFLAFGSNDIKAKAEINKYDSLGYATLMYKTYGTSGTKLSRHLLSYNNQSISFIAFHEATHLHLRKNAKLPYIYTEALCDLIGNYGSLNLAKQKSEMDYQNMLRFIENIENIAFNINECISAVELGDSTKRSTKQLQSLINNIDSIENQFLHERYTYDINTAYLLRNSSYTKYYFKLKELLQLFDNINEFLIFMESIPNNEANATKIIDHEIDKRSILIGTDSISK